MVAQMADQVVAGGTTDIPVGEDVRTRSNFAGCEIVVLEQEVLPIFAASDYFRFRTELTD
jgi:hypothetical protein